MYRTIIKDKVFLVTGSTEGIGRELVKKLLGNSCRVVVNGRSITKQGQVSEQLAAYESNYTYIPGDICDPIVCKKLIDGTISNFGRLDGLILNAGVTSAGKMTELEPDVAQKIISCNLTSAFYLLRYALPHLTANRGLALMVSSIAGLHGLPGHAAYSASKMALHSIFQCLNKELDGTGVQICISYVGFTENDPHKVRYRGSGEVEPIPMRKATAVASQQVTADKIFQQIVKRQAILIHSNLGKITYLLSRLFPSFVHFVILWKWRQKQF